MAPTKTNGTRTKKGVASSAPKTKMIKRAGSKRMGSVISLQTQYHSEAREVASSNRDDVSQKLDVLVKGVTDLSKRIEAMEECQKEGGASPSNSTSTSRPRRRANTRRTLTRPQRWQKKSVGGLPRD